MNRLDSGDPSVDTDNVSVADLFLEVLVKFCQGQSFPVGKRECDCDELVCLVVLDLL